MAFLAKQVTFVKGNVFVICADIHALLPTHFLTLPSPLSSASQWGQNESEVSGRKEQKQLGGFHLHLLVFTFVYQFNSRIEALVCSSFAND